jgi:hypothetical protein
VSEFDAIDEMDSAPPPARPKRVSVVWVWLFVVSCFLALAALLYFQYGVWVHPIHEPSDLDLVELSLRERFGTPIEILSSESVHGIQGQPLLRVKYREPVRGGGWKTGDRIYCIEDRKILWARDYQVWKWEVE